MSYFYPMGRVFSVLIWLCISLLSATSISAQRLYTTNSVLASGTWYKIAVASEGVYKIDLPLLTVLGVNSSGVNSSSIRVFGNGSQMLPEDPSAPRSDDLKELTLWVEDGGDGLLNGADYLAFYAQSPHRWRLSGTRFTHEKNLYTDTSYYYLLIGGSSKKIPTQPGNLVPNRQVTTFSERYFHELDTVNFLSSGRHWYGEEFSELPGRANIRIFPISSNWSNHPITVSTSLLSRSFSVGSRFTIRVANQSAVVSIPPVATGPYDQFVRSVETSHDFSYSGGNLAIEISYQQGSSGSQGWLDWFEISGRRSLSMTGVDQLLFRDLNSVGVTVAEFVIEDVPTDLEVWDITDPHSSIRMNVTHSGTQARFVNDCSILREYVAFKKSTVRAAKGIGRIPNQNLHQPRLADFLIVAHPELLSEANRLARFHESDPLTSLVVTTEQVFNEFSSGSPDPTAIRDFVKMFYDRAGADTSARPKYLLLFGDASFDYKSRIVNNTNLVPSYQSINSIDPLSTYVSDDYFGFLDDGDNINSSAISLLDIAIGRIPARSLVEARAMVDKIIQYSSPVSRGPWQNEITLIADDEDANLHLEDAEVMANTVSMLSSDLNINKVYLDAYQQEQTPAGARYPEVTKLLLNRILNGTLIWNYSGHGGYRRLAEEVVLDHELIDAFSNPTRLPLFITATCDVAPFDNPLINSIGENLLLRDKTGAIALVTTTRLVFAFSNRVMNKNFLEALLTRVNNQYPTLGQAMQRAKNTTYLFFGDVNNNRKFALLGDPALSLAFPRQRIQINSINGKPVGQDTLKALTTCRVEGAVVNASGHVFTNFNGTVYPTIFDKIQKLATRANDAGSIRTEFSAQEAIIFKGKASVTSGKFSFDFVVPRDIDYRDGPGKIGLFAESAIDDAAGSQTVMVGGLGDSISDNEGPSIRLFLNDEKFVAGGSTNQSPILLVKLKDSSGINVMGTGIGHDLEAVLDQDAAQRFILNKFYESDTDNFRAGTVRFQLPPISPGIHSIRVKAWDAANNSAEAYLDFQVVKDEKFLVSRVLNYPNPFTTRTEFWFEHNRPGDALQVTLQIFTITGKLVKTIRSAIISTGNRSNDVEWNGRDEYGSKLARGVYVYRLKVTAADGSQDEKIEKLYIL